MSSRMSTVGLCIALSLLAAAVPVLVDLEKNALDGSIFDLTLLGVSYLKHRNQHFDEVAIVAIDSESLASEIESVELPDGTELSLSQIPSALMGPVWAKLIDHLLSDQISAKRIGFDLFFVWNADRFRKNYDQRLRAQLYTIGVPKWYLGFGTCVTQCAVQNEKCKKLLLFLTEFI